MNQIEKQPFGKTGHLSTRTIFGAVGLAQVSTQEADQVLDLLRQYGVNHIDTAPLYGDSELRLRPWMKHFRNDFFLATKTDKRTYADAREQFYQSLDRLQVDHVDLLQLHNLTDVVDREIIMGPEGALEFLEEARDEGLARFIGITGHGFDAPALHLQSLKRFDFDTVLLPYNYLLMQNTVYTERFQALYSYCRENDIAMQTIKSIACGFWKDDRRSHTTWYRPLSDERAITASVHWVLGQTGVFLNTVGDVQELAKVLAAAACFQTSPPDGVMNDIAKEQEMEPLFEPVQ